MTRTNRLVRYALRQLERLSNAYDGVMRTGDEAAVHHLRVASRRLNEPLELMSPLAGHKKTAAAQKALKRLRRCLNKVRDLDVLSASLSRAASLMEGRDREIARLNDDLAEERLVEIGKSRRELRKREPLKLIRKIESLCESIGPRQAVRREKRIGDEAGRMWQHRAESLLAMSPEGEGAVDLHDVRVRLKGLRYLTELCDRVQRRDSAALLDVLTAMQDRLGAWNDNIMATRYISGMATEERRLSSDARYASFLLSYASARAKVVAAEHRASLAAWPRVEQALQERLNPCRLLPKVATGSEAGPEVRSEPMPARREPSPTAG